MTDPGVATDCFGSGALQVVLDAPRSGAADMELVRLRLGDLAAGTETAGLNVAEALPTAAFSRRDHLLPGYDAAEAAVARLGFAPILRPVGGHLAIYGDGALVLHHWAGHDTPRFGIQERFALLGGAIAGALRGLGVDARVGPVPGEYCDGAFSVNDSGRAKLVGTGQRIVRTGYLFSAVIMVHSVEPAREALTAAYAELGLPLDPATVGCVADAVPGITLAEVRAAVVAALVDRLLEGTRLGRTGGVTDAGSTAPRPREATGRTR